MRLFVRCTQSFLPLFLISPTLISVWITVQTQNASFLFCYLSCAHTRCLCRRQFFSKFCTAYLVSGWNIDTTVHRALGFNRTINAETLWMIRYISCLSLSSNPALATQSSTSCSGKHPSGFLVPLSSKEGVLVMHDRAGLTHLHENIHFDASTL